MHSLTRRPTAGLLMTGVASLSLCCAACNRYAQNGVAEGAPVSGTLASGEDHGHVRGPMGGAIASIGRDEYHAELVIEEGGVAAVYMLGADETRLYPVAEQMLTAYLSRPNQIESKVVLLRSVPLPDDAAGMTTRFISEIDESLLLRPLYLTIPGVRIDGERFTIRFDLADRNAAESHEPAMPAAVSDKEARTLYLTAGGLYTAEDIAANGGVTAGEKYRDFRAPHDPSPAAGERICPITQTKANPECTWIVGGETYLFCCPPCIDEFLQLAKTQPSEIQPAAAYVKGAPPNE